MEQLVIRCDNCGEAETTAILERQRDTGSPAHVPSPPAAWTRAVIPPATEQGDLCPGCTAAARRAADRALAQRQPVRSMAMAASITTPATLR